MIGTASRHKIELKDVASQSFIYDFVTNSCVDGRIVLLHGLLLDSIEHVSYLLYL